MKRLLLLTTVIGVCVGFASAQTTVTLRPTSDGSVKQWTNNAGTACTSATCYTQVAESTGATNCTSSSLVKGDGTYNKSPATTGQVEQYGLTLSGISNNSLIQSITVHACEARGGSNNTAGTLRIVLNGGTTTCSSNQSVTSTYADFSCTFGSLNVTKGSGTTLEIGNATTQTRAIWMDTIEAQVTYIAQQAGAVAAAYQTSPVVAATKAHPVAESASFTTTPTVARVNSPTNHTASMTAAFGTSVVVKPVVIPIVTASYHIGVGASDVLASHGAAAIAFSTSPTVTGVRNNSKGTSASASFSPVCCPSSSSPLNATVHFGVGVSTSVQASHTADAGTSLSTSVSVVATGSVDLGRSATAACSAQPAICAFTDSPLTASFHVSPAVTGVKHGSQSGLTSAAASISPVCQSCLGHYFDSASFTVAPVVTAFKGNASSATTSAHVSPAAATVLNYRRWPSATFHTSDAVGGVQAGTAALASLFTVSSTPTAVSSSAGPKSVGATASFTTSSVVDESASTSSNVSQSAHVSPTVKAGVNLTESKTIAVAFSASASAFGRGPKAKFVMVVSH